MFITGDRIHDGNRFLPEGCALEYSDDGTILGIHQNFSGYSKHYPGIISPGFINAHCHLELSHLKGLIPKHTGLIPFLLKIITGRQSYTEEDKRVARHHAYNELYNNGVVAVGDIGNTTDTLDVRALDKMHIHTFVEVLGFNEEAAQQSFDFYAKVYEAYSQQETKDKVLRQSATPHAPYSVSKKLFEIISDFDKRSILSVHNQECKAENDYYFDKKGEMRTLIDTLNIDDSSFNPSGKSSLQTYTEWVDSTHPVLFIHNTLTSKEDIRTALLRFPHCYFCLCPNANLYIENSLPDVRLLMSEQATICVGTDSLSSNDELSILSELLTLKDRFDLDWEVLLQWACINGAKALQLDGVAGSFETGKQPGIIQIYQDRVERIV